jgi:AcrR family transcriptional regulator
LKTSMRNREFAKEIETIVKDQDLIGKRHTQICDAALKLFSHKGFHQTTVREIADACGLGIGTLYSYIKTKDDILLLVYRRILRTFETRMLRATQGIQDPRIQLRAALEETVKIYDECQDAVLLLYQESHALGRQELQGLFEVDRAYVGIFREILERGNDAGIFAVQQPHLLAVCILFLCAVWDMKRWNLEKYTLDAMVECLSSFVLKGISADGAGEVQARSWGEGSD